MCSFRMQKQRCRPEPVFSLHIYSLTSLAHVGQARMHVSLSGQLNLKDRDRCGAEVYLKTDGWTDKGLTIYSVYD